MSEWPAPETEKNAGILQTVRPALAIALLAVWTWLVLRGHGDPAPFGFNDEYGPLAGSLPSAAICLYLLAALKKTPSYGLLWNIGCLALCCPAFLELADNTHNLRILEIILNIIAGYGFATAFVAIAAQMSGLAPKGVIVASCGGLIAGCSLIQLVLWLDSAALILMPVVIALMLKLLSGNLERLSITKNRPATSGGQKWGIALIFILVGFSFGLYGSLMAVMIPLLPQPQAIMPMTFAIATSISGLSIYMAIKNFAWRVALLICPFLLIGYTAWPILHRESPAISLSSLHLANIFMSTLTAITVFRQDYGDDRAMSSDMDSGTLVIGASLLFGAIAGFSSMPVIRAAFSTGTAINYLFAMLNLAILGSCWAMIYFLGITGFWRGRMIAHKRDDVGGISEVAEDKKENEDTIREKFEHSFREMGLTRRQAVIASYLAIRKDDVFICSRLNISANTLKTHVRNILHKLRLNSRYELPWLVSREYKAGGS